jgi:hypothetical protein
MYLMKGPAPTKNIILRLMYSDNDIYQNEKL